MVLHLRPFSLSDGEQADPLSKRAGVSAGFGEVLAENLLIVDVSPKADKMEWNLQPGSKL